MTAHPKVDIQNEQHCSTFHHKEMQCRKSALHCFALSKDLDHDVFKSWSDERINFLGIQTVYLN